jgi:hypothetical protein
MPQSLARGYVPILCSAEIVCTPSRDFLANDMAWNWVSDTREIGSPLRGFRFPGYSTQGAATTRFARMALPWALIRTSLWDWLHSERERKTTMRRRETPSGLRNRVGR